MCFTTVGPFEWFEITGLKISPESVHPYRLVSHRLEESREREVFNWAMTYRVLGFEFSVQSYLILGTIVPGLPYRFRGRYVV